jgi:hypothetical protein
MTPRALRLIFVLELPTPTDTYSCLANPVFMQGLYVRANAAAHNAGLSLN